MCGLVGIVGNNITLNGRKFFEQALQVDTIRGSHSTGLLTIDDSSANTARWYKDCVNGYDFVRNKTVKEMLGYYHKSHAYLGHNRAATIGDVNRKNAHPFRVNDIILMHNGTLVSTHDLEGHGKYEVDSNVIAHSIDKVGIEETAKNINGAFALVWYDLKDATINFCRNDDRPLWFGKVKERFPSASGGNFDDNQWVYASELAMLKWLAARNSLEVEEYMQLKTEKLMSFDATSNFARPTITDLEYRKQVKYYNTGFQGSGGPFPPLAPVSRVPVQGASMNVDGTHFQSGQRVSFYPTYFEPYKTNAAKGDVHGWLGVDPWSPVEARGVWANDLEVTSVWRNGEHYLEVADGEYTATAMAVMNTPESILLLKGDSIQINGTGPKVVEIKQEEDEQGDLFVPGVGQLLIPIKEWLRGASGGCAWCSADLTEEDAEESLMLDHQTILCPECVEDNVLESVGGLQ